MLIDFKIKKIIYGFLNMYCNVAFFAVHLSVAISKSGISYKNRSTIDIFFCASGATRVTHHKVQTQFINLTVLYKTEASYKRLLLVA